MKWYLISIAGIVLSLSILEIPKIQPKVVDLAAKSVTHRTVTENDKTTEYIVGTVINKGKKDYAGSNRNVSLYYLDRDRVLAKWVRFATMQVPNLESGATFELKVESPAGTDKDTVFLLQLSPGDLNRLNDSFSTNNTRGSSKIRIIR